MAATLHSPNGMVCAADHLAAGAGTAILRGGGSAADAAIAANAVMAVTSPHQCGLGGDLFAMVHHSDGAPLALNASGRAGSGADPDRLRDAGATTMPLHHDIRTVTVPGCVDGLLALHARFGRLPLAEVFDSAIGYARNGFGASPLLSGSIQLIADSPGAEDLLSATSPGARVRRPGVAAALEDIAADGRESFYRGEFGAGLIKLGAGEFTADDLAAPQADWVDPLHSNAYGHDIWTMPPNSQGYVLLLSLAIADRLDLPDDPADPRWAHLLIEAARQAGRDRPDRLHEDAPLSSLLTASEVARRTALIDPRRRSDFTDHAATGDTTYLCAVDASGMGVSLIQSNAAGFGSRIFEPTTGIGLHNRGLGFNLIAGHPAEYRPRRRPPHTLAPTIVTDQAGRLRAVAGTMGGDTQPQILLQVLTRLLRNNADAGTAISAPRWRVANSTGFDTWTGPVAGIELEASAPGGWDELPAFGHRTHRVAETFGHAQLIELTADGIRAGAADPRALIGAASGY